MLWNNWQAHEHAMVKSCCVWLIIVWNSLRSLQLIIRNALLVHDAFAHGQWAISRCTRGQWWEATSCLVFARRGSIACATWLLTPARRDYKRKVISITWPCYRAFFEDCAWQICLCFWSESAFLHEWHVRYIHSASRSSVLISILCFWIAMHLTKWKGPFGDSQP